MCWILLKDYFLRYGLGTAVRYGQIYLSRSSVSSFDTVLNDDSLLQTFFQRSIVWLHTIIMSLCNCHAVSFCIWYLYLVYEKNNQPFKQTNKHAQCFRAVAHYTLFRFTRFWKYSLLFCWSVWVFSQANCRLFVDFPQYHWSRFFLSLDQSLWPIQKNWPNQWCPAKH